MNRIARFASFAIAISAMSTYAQSVISVHSGTIHYVEGKVFLNDQAISPRFGEFPAMDNNAVLRTTAEGRVEVLLVPGAILRVGEGSSVRMVSNTLEDTRVELQAGRAVLECDEILKGDAVALLVGGRTVSFAKNGIYEATAEPASVQVYKGEATVASDGNRVVVKKGHEAVLGSELAARKFDENNTDDLFNWSSRRSGYLALANVSAARSMGSGFASGGWTFNPWLDMFTMVPGSGMMWSPFGYGFFSPYMAYGYYPYGGGYYGGSYGGTGSSTSYGGRPVTQAGSLSTGATSVSSGRLGNVSGGYSGGGGNFGNEWRLQRWRRAQWRRRRRRRRIGGGGGGGRGGH